MRRTQFASRAFCAVSLRSPSPANVKMQFKEKEKRKKKPNTCFNIAAARIKPLYHILNMMHIMFKALSQYNMTFTFILPQRKCRFSVYYSVLFFIFA